MVLVVIYLAIAFEWRMAVAALVALIHDLTITIGVYALVGFEVTPGHRDRSADHPRLLALRHGRRLRQPQGEHARTSPSRTRCTYSEIANRSINEHPGPLDQHHGGRAAAGRRPAVHRWRPPRRGHAQRHLAVAVRRPRGRCVLLDLHRHAARRRPQGARAGDEGPGKRVLRQAGARRDAKGERAGWPRRPTATTCDDEPDDDAAAARSSVRATSRRVPQPRPAAAPPASKRR